MFNQAVETSDGRWSEALGTVRPVGTFTYWFGLALVVIVVAIGLKEIVVGWRKPTQVTKCLVQVAVLFVVLPIIVVVPPMQLLNRASWRFQFGTFSATATPPYVDLCGRRFYSAGHRNPGTSRG